MAARAAIRELLSARRGFHVSKTEHRDVDIGRCATGARAATFLCATTSAGFDMAYAANAPSGFVAFQSGCTRTADLIRTGIGLA